MNPLSNSWKYISEGNVHIVLQLEDTNYVIRLIKEDEKPVQRGHLEQSLRFVNNIMVPLLENYHYGVAKLVDISHNNLEELCKDLQPFRPKKRLNKVLLSPFAIKTVNLTTIGSECNSPVYCIEIKPKEGFMASSLRKYSKCYYCLKQHLKIHNKDIKQISLYCPLDLFSGNRDRMKRSLDSLMVNPQNNFKMFKDGVLVYDNKLQEDVDQVVKSHTPFNSKDLLANFVIAVLLHEKNKYSEINVGETAPVSQSVSKDSLISCDESNILQPGCLLYNILHLQKLSEGMLDNIELNEPDYTYVTKLNELLEEMKLKLNLNEDKKTFFRTVDMVHLSLISAIAKDCSIMISFSNEYVEGVPYIQVQENNELTRVYFKMAVTDLEPKPFRTLLKRKDTEKQIIEIYEKYLSDSTKC